MLIAANLVALLLQVLMTGAEYCPLTCLWSNEGNIMLNFQRELSQHWRKCDAVEKSVVRVEQNKAFVVHSPINSSINVILLLLCNEDKNHFMPNSKWKISCNFLHDMLIMDERILTQQKISIQLPQIKKTSHFRYFVLETRKCVQEGVVKYMPSSAQASGTVALNRYAPRTRRQVNLVEGFILASVHKSIYRISLDGTRSTTLVSNNDDIPADLDYDYRRSKMYWIDRAQGTILQANLDGTGVVTILDEEVSAPSALAVDWITSKIYVTYNPNASSAIISVFDPLNFFFKNLIQLKNPQITTIALDPNERKMYWNGDHSIMRASMDGTSIESIHNYTLPGSPRSLTVDYEAQRIYWTSDDFHILGSNLDGGTIVYYKNDTDDIRSIEIHSNHLYTTERLIPIIHLDNPRLTRALLRSDLSCQGYEGIKVVCNNCQPLDISNPCAHGNGGCTHLCLLSDNDMHYSCACPEGLTPQGNTTCEVENVEPQITLEIKRPGLCSTAGHSTCCDDIDSCMGSPANCYCDSRCKLFGDCCLDAPTCATEGTSSYFIFSGYSNIFVIDSVTNKRFNTLESGLQGMVALDYHYRMKAMFWTSAGGIWKSDLLGKKKQLLLATNNSNPIGLAVDWISDKIYWTDSALNTINVLDLNSGFGKVLIQLEAQVSSSIEVDPNARQVYWIQNGNFSCICQASMDGLGDISVLWSSEFELEDLALDLLQQKLYWTNETHFGYIFTNGSHSNVFSSPRCIQSLIPSDSGDLFYLSCARLREYGIVFENGTLGTPRRFGCDIYHSKFVSPHLQIIQGSRNPCANNNGGCSELCVLSAIQDEQYICANFTQLYSNRHNNNCSSAGLTRCCEDAGDCRVFPSLCSCDSECRRYGDCCSDIDSICPIEVPTDPPTPMINLTVRVDPSVVNVNQHDSAMIRCQVQSSSSELITTEWHFISRLTNQEMPVFNHSRSIFIIRYINGSVLHIRNATFVTDQGYYRCRVTVGYTTESSSCEVNILFFPQPISIITSNSTMENHQIQIACTFRANPMPTIIWVERNPNESINPSPTLRVSIEDTYNQTTAIASSRLTITNSVPEDSGIYICEATNFLNVNPVLIDTEVTVVPHNDCSVAGKSPCQNGGVCVDQLNSYSCICPSNMYLGQNCSQQNSNPPPEPLPPRGGNLTLSEPKNFTCRLETQNGAGDGISYEWYKDGILLEGKTQSFLYIPEVTPEKRGNYSCKVITGGGEEISTPGQLDIPEILQYNITFIGINNNTDLEEIANNIITLGASINESLIIVSVKTVSRSMTNATILVTLLKRNDTSAIEDVRRLFTLFLKKVFYFEEENVIIKRFDGCDEEEYKGILWPETSVRRYANEPCTCSEFVQSLAGRALRFCMGNYENGSYWSTTIDTSDCAVTRSDITQQLCDAARDATNSSVVVAETVANITSNFEKLEAADISATSAVLRQITATAITDVEVAYNYLEIIDNIQQARRDEVFSSQKVTRSSQSIIESLEKFSDLFVGIKNTSVFPFSKFAIQLEDVNSSDFRGQCFLVNLGSVEEALQRETSIEEDDLYHCEEILRNLKNATALVELPETLLKEKEKCAKNQKRISYFVYLTDTLFQTEPRANLASIIISVRMRCVGEERLSVPVIVEFKQLMNDSKIELAKNASNESRVDVTTKAAPSTNSMYDSSSCGKESNIVANIESTENCTIYDYSLDEFGGWSTDACQSVYSSDGRLLRCECKQLGHYALLFDLNPKPPPCEVALILNVLVYVGTIISLLALLTLVVTYLCSEKLRTSTHSQILIHMSISLAGLYIFFMLAGHVTNVIVLCGMVSAILHYMMLVFFLWTSVEAVWLYIKLVKVFGTRRIEEGFIWKASLLSWIIPLIVVIISTGAGHKYYISSYHCTVKQWPFWFGLLLPFAGLQLFNWIMFVVILVSVFRNRNSMKMNKTSSFKNTIKNAVIAFALAVMFGLGWSFGLAATSSSLVELTSLFQILFTLLISLQGLLMFILHGIRNSDARAVWKKFYVSTCGKHISGFRKLYTVTAPTSESNHLASGGTFSSTLMNTLPRKHNSSSKNGHEEVCSQELSHELSVAPKVTEDNSAEEVKVDLSAPIAGDSNNPNGSGSETMAVASDNEVHNIGRIKDKNEITLKQYYGVTDSVDEKQDLSAIFSSCEDEVDYSSMQADDDSENEEDDNIVFLTGTENVC